MFRARQRRRADAKPHICATCGSDLVYAVRWDEFDERHFFVRTRCAECETWREGVFRDEVLEPFVNAHFQSARLIADGADRLHREWRSQEVEIFANALRRDLIGADDFA